MRRVSTIAILVVLFLAVAAGQSASAPGSGSPRPADLKVIHMDDPIYPPLARQARISGDVRIRVTTDGLAVTGTSVIEGHAMLKTAAEENLRSWKFAPHEATSFVVTFRYKFSGEEKCEFLPPVVTLHLPQEVDIVQAPEWTCDPVSVITRKKHWWSRPWFHHSTQSL